MDQRHHLFFDSVARTFMASVFAFSIASCGGGSGAGNNSEGASPPPPTPKPQSLYPVLARGGSFVLPTLAEPTARPTVGDSEQSGRVILDTTEPKAGLTVEWLDASIPNAPIVLATSATQADGSFRLERSAVTTAPVDQWIRVTTSDGGTLRAYATHSVDVSPGTEAAVSELARLRKAGAFTAHALTAEELSSAQESTTLLWLGIGANQTTTVEADTMVEHIRYSPAWNDLLTRFSLPSPALGAGDVSALMPSQGSQASWPSTVTENGVQRTATYTSSCFATNDGRLQCPISAVDAQALGDNFIVDSARVIAFLSGDSTPFGEITNLFRELPLIDLPYVPGTKILYEKNDIDLVFNPDVRASAKVTRRTYPVSAVEALGSTVQAVLVVVDYEIATLDIKTGIQTDHLSREKRWFSPAHGRILFAREDFARSAQQVSIGNASATHTQAATVANSVSGAFITNTSTPFAGVADVVAVGVKHRHAVYSAQLNRVYVASPDQGGQILELDGGTLLLLRSLKTSSVPARLALSSDGQRLYAGLDGGHLTAWSVADLSLIFDVLVPTDSNGAQYPRIFDISIDPFDERRVIVLAGGLQFGNSGVLLVYRDGTLISKQAPSYSDTNYGWDFYSPNAIAWTTVRNEYLAASFTSPKNLFRFRVDETAGTTTEVSSLLRVNEVDWHDIGGQLLTESGKSLDAVTFAEESTLNLNATTLTSCHRQDVDSDVCRLQTGSVLPELVRLDHATSLFLGAYTPNFNRIPNGCDPSAPTDPAYVANYNGLSFTPMSGNRSLVSTVEGEDSTGDVDHCSLQIWTLHGVLAQ